jgi:actin related protein 2/3 complex subunit 1A/1B
MKTRVFSAYIKGVDEKPKASAWGERLPFNTLCAEYSTGHGSWIHAVQFSPDGSQLAWVSHDSSISIADPENGSVDYVPTQFLPFLSLQWLSPESIIAAGHDCQPMLFARKGGKWEYTEKLDQQEKTKKAAGSAFDKFKQMDSRAQQENTGTELTTTHQNSITQVRKYGNEIATCGVDGKIVVWVALAEQMGRMKV